MNTNYRSVNVTVGGGGTLIASIVTDSAMSDTEVRAEILNAVQSSEISRYVSDQTSQNGVEISNPESVSLPPNFDLDTPLWTKNGESYWKL